MALLAHGEARPTVAAIAEAASVGRRSATPVVKTLETKRRLLRNPMRFGPGAGLVLAVSVGSENVRAALLDANGAFHRPSMTTLSPDRSQLDGQPGVLLGRVRQAVQNALDVAFDDASLLVEKRLPLLGVTVALPSPVGRDGYAHGNALADKEWLAVPLVDRIKAAFPTLPAHLYVDVMNNANAAAIAVAFDDARARASGPPESFSEVVFAVHIAGGIGAGTVQLAPYRRGDTFALNRSRLVVGSQGFAGELGHFPLDPASVRRINDDRPSGLAPIKDRGCSCRARGHLEGYASARSLIERLRDSDYDLDARRAAGPKLDRLLEQPDDRVRRALHDTGRLVGRALASPILMLDPRRITLTGYLARAEVAAGVAREQHTWSAGFGANIRVGLVEGDDRNFVEIRGAAIAVFRRRLYSSFAELADPSKFDHLLAYMYRRDIARISSG